MPTVSRKPVKRQVSPLKKIGEIPTMNGVMLVVSRNRKTRRVHLKFGGRSNNIEYLFILHQDDAEKLKNLLEKADSSA